jgi:hypothetical protein
VSNYVYEAATDRVRQIPIGNAQPRPTTVARTAGPDHTVTLIAKLNLALVLLKEAHVRDAERLQRETLTAELRVHGPQNPHTLSTQTDLAETLLQERRYTVADALARETFEIQRRTLGPQHPDTL